jgi:hypothetical protein
VNGASSWATVTRHSRSVANARASPSQNRRRERRTYQLERSSTNVAISRAPPVASNASRRSVTASTVPASRDRIQRSRSVGGAGSASSAGCPAASAAFSYSTRNP